MSRRAAAPQPAGRLNHILSAGIEHRTLRTIGTTDTGMLPKDLREEAARRFNIPGGPRWYDDPVKKAEYVRILKSEGFGKKEARPTPYQRPEVKPAPKPTPAVEPKPFKKVFLVTLQSDDDAGRRLAVTTEEALEPESLETKYNVDVTGEESGAGWWYAFVYDDDPYLRDDAPVAGSNPATGDDTIYTVYTKNPYGSSEVVAFTADEVMLDLLSRPNGFQPVFEPEYGNVHRIWPEALYIGLRLWKRVSPVMRERVLREVFAEEIGLLMDY